MAARLDGKVAIVVGAGSAGPGWGNGKATAALFAREGARVLCADVNLEAAEETAAIITGEGGEAIAVRADVSKHDDIERMVRSCVDAYGQVDVLDYNVGLAHVGGVVELPEADWDRVMDINLKGCFLTMKHVIPLMEAHGGGSIINISSVAGIRHTGVPYDHLLRLEGRHDPALQGGGGGLCAEEHPRQRGAARPDEDTHGGNLRRARRPSTPTATWRPCGRPAAAQCPMGRMGDAWDVAYACLFLASDESRYVTGLELVVDGGITLKYS